MSASQVAQYVVTLRYQEEGLTDILELNSALVNGGFTTSLADKDGKPHELGTNSFGIVSALSEEEIRKQAEGLGEMALGQKPEVEVQHLDAFLKDSKA
ncbi:MULTISPECIES: type V toxin-antitoxin system endoribonuclease antitoxin GhoS [Erwinia]|uniref:type V toxin-antitoxin system endoribonuclease antitoxin GhoS n=1 Tax=Erwinia TaxID=551 RepID=UPI0005545231|nr:MULTISPECIES: type V toxin-antitoxin system endoribonuclease antitoxin GhoS [Erwinia]